MAMKKNAGWGVSMRLVCLEWVSLQGGGGAWRTKAGAEAHGGETICGVVGGRVRAIGVVEGLEGCCPAEPEGAEGAEDDEGECVADEELRSQYGGEREGVVAPYLAERSKYHQKAAEEIVCTGSGGT
jgi:hypothetical protein